ncbi:pleckstrin homology domain-containing family N member 1 isoform X3 [Ictidomys tridecemlineatus]|uniref:pleckstrin homology domain-containing family N member 1 isoform X2 n=1 Tax=Ictidomys tridecemlineatus TaxID=43179 RepID=UPI000B5412D2|nr:pleckstrin homology domain-containing family N member 1 isoform X2 [Ictidomys tridecemlineatus]KAG3281850.1 pleckstrin homology domain containing N1, transcript variant X2 [Ictidomys tridecemlineatus]
MGNSHCVPQTPRRLRASFSRKPSLKGNREDASRKLAGLFGSEAGPDGDAAADKIFYYIPGTDFPGLENQPENLEQPILSVFKKGRRKVPVRNLGKVVHYAKVQLRFQHSQDTSDCYLELFPSHLYFQAHSSAGLTFQGLLPLVELSICPLEETGEHGFQITGPLPAPLLVLCPSEDELRCWLYHLEKQMALVGGLRRCHSAPPQGPSGDELPWSLQRRLTWLRRASGRESVGSAICASRVKLQHLPSQEQWDRLLVLYPTSLAIFSEEPDGIAFKGELPLTAIHIDLEEKQTRSFLISGRLIHTIRVLCASHEDYRHWLLCLQRVSRQDGGPLLLNPESFPGLQGPTQVTGGVRGSLSSDGRTSWDSGCPAPPSNRTSHSLPESSVPSTAGCPAPAQPAPGQPNSESDCASIGQRRADLRRSSRSRGQARGELPGPAVPPHLHLDLTQVGRLGLECGPEAPEQPLEAPHSPLYADPYTPPATSHRRIADIRGLDEVSGLLVTGLNVPQPEVREMPKPEFLSAVRSSPAPEPSSPFPSVPVSVPVSDPCSGLSSSPGPPAPHLVSRKGALQSRASRRHRGSIKNRGPQPPDSPQLVSPAREVSPSPLPPPSDGDKTSSSSHQKWPRLRRLEAEGGLIQWI